MLRRSSWIIASAAVVSLAIFGGTSHRHRQVRIVPKLSRDAVRTAGLGTADCKNGVGTCQLQYYGGRPTSHPKGDPADRAGGADTTHPPHNRAPHSAVPHNPPLATPPQHKTQG